MTDLTWARRVQNNTRRTVFVKNNVRVKWMFLVAFPSPHKGRVGGFKSKLLDQISPSLKHQHSQHWKFCYSQHRFTAYHGCSEKGDSDGEVSLRKFCPGSQVATHQLWTCNCPSSHNTNWHEPERKTFLFKKLLIFNMDVTSKAICKGIIQET